MKAVGSCRLQKLGTPKVLGTDGHVQTELTHYLTCFCFNEANNSDERHRLIEPFLSLKV